MKLMLFSAISLVAMVGSAYAASEIPVTVDSPSEVSAMYPVDENHDGRTDRMLELEQSDSLA